MQITRKSFSSVLVPATSAPTLEGLSARPQQNRHVLGQPAASYVALDPASGPCGNPAAAAVRVPKRRPSQGNGFYLQRSKKGNLRVKSTHLLLPPPALAARCSRSLRPRTHEALLHGFGHSLKRATTTGIVSIWRRTLGEEHTRPAPSVAGLTYKRGAFNTRLDSPDFRTPPGKGSARAGRAGVCKMQVVGNSPDLVWPVLRPSEFSVFLVGGLSEILVEQRSSVVLVLVPRRVHRVLEQVAMAGRRKKQRCVRPVSVASQAVDQLRIVSQIMTLSRKIRGRPS